MNRFGQSFSVSIFGESHGELVGCLVDGCPAGLRLSPADLEPDLARRRSGAAGTTRRLEADTPRIATGTYLGLTTGAPILVLFANTDVRSGDYENLAGRPRPGHADFSARARFGGFADPRGGGIFSGRLTVGLVAAGAIARKLMAPIEVAARLVEAGGSTDAAAAVAAAEVAHDSIGGGVACRVVGLPAGVGDPFFDSVESLVSHALFAVPGVKAVGFGAGFGAARLKGSEHNDAILDAGGRTATNNAGGINGGITNGNEVVFEVALRPPASIALPQSTVDLATSERVAIEVHGRHDACFALRVPVVVEAVTAIVLADLLIRGGRIPPVLAQNQGEGPP